MSVALKAYRRLVVQWGLTAEETAALLGPDDDDRITRVSAVLGIYKVLGLYFSEPLSWQWFTRPNTGPMFDGQRPIDTAIEGGVPKLIEIRRYVEGLLGPALVEREPSEFFTQRAAEQEASRAKDQADMASGAVSEEDMPRIDGGGMKSVRYFGPSLRMQALAEQIKLPDDEWQKVESPEALAKDAMDDLDKIDWAGIVSTVPGLRGGRPVIRGMRITVGDILGWLASGMSETVILENFPELTLTDIRAALAFAAERER